MRAITLNDRQLAYTTEQSIPVLEEGEALIKLRLAGICSTDLELVKGYYPYNGVLGHEFVGEVVVAPGNEAWVGKRVAGEISIYCGACEHCRNGRTAHCQKRRTLGIANYDGAFADYLKLPVRNLWEVPDAVEDRRAVFTELLAAALQIQQQVQVKPADKVIVVGAGRLGLLVAQCLALTGCHLQVLIRRPEPGLLLQRWGIAAVRAEDVEPHSADMVVEVTGSAAGFALSRSLVRPRGTLVLKSTFAGDVSLNLSSLVVDEINLIGSRCGPFGAALRLLEQDRVDVLSLISAEYALEDGLAGFEAAAQAGVLKVVLRP